jgi:hypothetical protein
MNLRSTFTPSRLRRSCLLLFPRTVAVSPVFTRVSRNLSEHARLLAEVQRFRGRIALEEGAITPRQLTADGRHSQAADHSGIHLIRMDTAGEIVSAMRYVPHSNRLNWTDLGVGQTPLAADPLWRPVLADAVESELEKARRYGFSYVEMGGWVIAKELRCTSEAALMVAGAYALASVLGGALGITTATKRHGSSSILKRLGGESLMGLGKEVPAYFDPHYQTEMELLRFDSSCISGRCAGAIQHLREALPDTPIIAPEGSYEMAAAASFNCYRKEMQPANAL